MGHLASTEWKQCPHSVLHPEAQPEAIAQAACARRRDAGGRRPQPEGSTRHPKGHRAKDHLVRVQAAFTRHATQETVILPHGREGLQAQASRPSLTDHRLLTTGASSPSRVASPVTALATVSPHVEGNTPPRKSHSQCVRRPPRDGGSASRARGAYKLKRLGPHSPITGFSQPGRPAHPASPLLSPRLRRSARTWKATRPSLNPTSQCVRRPPPGRGMSSNRNDVREQGGRVKKEGAVGRGNSPTIPPAHVGRSGPCGQRTGAAPSVQGLRPASRTSGQRSQAAASVQELRPAFTGLRPASRTSGQRSQGCGQRSQPAASVQDKRPAFTGLRPAFTACGQRSQPAASVQDKRPAAQRAFVAVPGVDINRADFSYSARAFPLESFRRFGGRARSGHQPCLFFILSPDHPPRELQEVWWPCPEWTSTVPIFHTQLGQVTACGQRSQASGQRSQDSGQSSQAAASVQDKRPAFTGSGQRSGQAASVHRTAASVHRLRPAFRTSGQRSQPAASVHRLRPAFRTSGQRSGQAASVHSLRPAFTGCGQRSGPSASVHRLRPAFRTSGQRSQAAASVQDKRPAFRTIGQRSQPAASVHRLRPAFGTSGQRSQAAASVQDKRPAFTGCGQRSGQAPSVHRLRPAFRTSGQRSQPAASVHRLWPAFRTSGQRSQAAASVQDKRPAFTGCGRRSGQAASVHRLRPAFRTSGQRSGQAASVHSLRPAFTGCGQRSGQAASVHSLRPAFRTSGQRSQAAASVQDKRPAFTACGQRSQDAASVQDKRPAFTGCGQRSGQAASFHRLRPAFRTSGQRSQAAASVQDKRPAFTGCGKRSGQAASVHRPRPAFRTSGQRSQAAASVHRLPPAFTGSGQRSGQAASRRTLDGASCIHGVEAMPAQCSASRSTARGHSPSRVRTATRRGWTTAPARRVHPTPQGGIERKIISLGSKLPSRGMQRRKPSSVQGLPAPGSSPEEDRAWTCLTGARGLQAQASKPSLTDHRLLTTGASSPSRVASPVTALATVSPHVEGNTPPRKSHSQCVRRPPRDGGVTLPEAKPDPRGGPSSARQGSVQGSHGNKAFDIMPCHAMHGRWLPLTLLLPQLLAKHLPYKELL
ncbi:hypothetical protein Cgig2_014316 [Carnegiea gigantea]|uniref:Uncharacterized protein n=1 Tax=Carnegiea gigantea TaxID=171969 RepID=A0A9Q1JH33_9CARY|nr:hypothetical protein Cgig2_014316 [Carnegiea gigantea]